MLFKTMCENSQICRRQNIFHPLQFWHKLIAVLYITEVTSKQKIPAELQVEGLESYPYKSKTLSITSGKFKEIEL